jgi:hypothetical protein
MPLFAASSMRRVVRKAAPGTCSSNVGSPYVMLGPAFETLGKAAEARTAFRWAGERLQKTVGPDKTR